jgi:hypothetical protein
MDPMLILQLAVQYGPLIKQIIDGALSNTDIVTKITTEAKPIASLLESIGAQFFPKAAPTLHIVGAVVAAFDPNTTKWLQGALNALLTPSPNLVVDGIYGNLTKAAVEQLQTQLGLKVDGIAGEITKAAITLALSKLPNFNAAPPAVAATPVAAPTP